MNKQRAIGQIYVSITTNDFHMVNYQIQQVLDYLSFSFIVLTFELSKLYSFNCCLISIKTCNHKYWGIQQ